jgi:hypothetical protein
LFCKFSDLMPQQGRRAAGNSRANGRRRQVVFSTRLPDRLGLSRPANTSGAIFSALCGTRSRELTGRQRQVFVAIVLHQVPLDAVVAEQNSSRNAIYKTMPGASSGRA